MPTGVLMVGSVPGTSATQIFTRLATALPNRLNALPDGETGERWNYIGWQLQRFPASSRRMELGGTPLPESGPPTFTLADIQSTGYDEVAIASYADFSHLRAQSVISPTTRFQICLPSTYNVLQGHLKTEVAPLIEPLYEQRLSEALKNITSRIPHEDVVIQWDLCFELTALEFSAGGYTNPRHKAYFSGPVLPGIVSRVVRMCESIPRDVKVAFHLCYGDLGHKHFVDPEGTGFLVDLANALMSEGSIGSRTEWVHVPVPKGRVDEEYFEDMKRLELDKYKHAEGASRTKLYLGLVHAHDESGTRERIKVAENVVPFDFGVATECGMGRTPPEDVESILSICSEVTGGSANAYIKPRLI
ncbi:hypothetical protein K491DRAFT_651455 [Lophiostoma macrostomum CBS 122681]|uniref:UROD/MetE-like protein n=1 Tax=Lophiostoma macrostomum CBS 122681 TaxID=1314788 RepID=A0A6A6TJZ0_9PLEO|nr:hypothetical protein K491DRAFT_651455 [Lophiostoma macrostomum CBS 122681]